MLKSQDQSAVKFAWRVAVDRYNSEAALQRLADFVRKNLDVIDEIALFDSFTHHLYIPLDQYQVRAEKMGACLRKMKEIGVRSTGINVLTTIGHINEAWDYNPPLPFQPLVGHDGKVAKGCGCPNSTELQAYVREKYRMVAEQAPEFIWVDDDIRMHHHSIDYPCFCPTCLDLFSKASGETWTREALVDALNQPERTDLRQAWVDHISRSIVSVLTAAEEAIHCVDPHIKTGLMTGGPSYTTYAGMDFDRWMGTLRATKGRPGGGFYSDFQRLGVLDKAFDTGRQVYLYPPEINDRQYELENFPYQTRLKSVNSMMNECALALEMGVNGIAFNAIGMWDGCMEEFTPIAQGARQYRPIWEQWVAHTQGMKEGGGWIAWNNRVTAKREVRPGEDWFKSSSRYEYAQAHILSQIGLPLCAEPEGDFTVLYGGIVDALSDEILLACFRRGVWMDSEALDAVTRSGLGHLAGAKIQRRLDNGVVECFSADSLNGKYAGEMRDARIEFWGNALGKADLLEPLSPKTRILANMQDFYKRTVGPCMTAYENELGGRCVVMGYAPWMFLYSQPKMAQLKSIADWLCYDRLPVKVTADGMVIPFIRLSAGREHGGLLLLNAGMESVKHIKIELRAPAKAVVLLTEKGPQSIAIEPDAQSAHFTIPSIDAWSTQFYCF